MFERNHNNPKTTQTNTNNNNPTLKSFIKQRTISFQPSVINLSRQEQLPHLSKHNVKRSLKSNYIEINTPQFNQRYEPDMNYMSEYQSSSGIQNIINNSRHKELAVQITESFQDYPQLTQKLNINFQRNLMKMMIFKIKNDVRQLKVLRSQFQEYIKEVESLISYFKEKISVEIEDFFNNQQPSRSGNNGLRALEYNYQELFQENKVYINNLQALLNKKTEEINRIQTKLLQQQQKNKNDPNPTNSNTKTPCINCQVYNFKLATLKNENEDLKCQVDRLLQENQINNEQIFDLEQKIAGLDLQVQKRLKQQMKLLILPMDRASVQRQKQEYLFIINKLNQENSSLQKKFSYLQNMTVRESELKDRQRQLVQRQKHYRLKQDGLIEAIQHNQKIQQKLSNKQTQLMVVQENFKKTTTKPLYLNNNQSERINNNQSDRNSNDWLDRIPKSNHQKPQQSIQLLHELKPQQYSHTYIKDKLNISGQSLQSFGYNHKTHNNPDRYSTNMVINHSEQQNHMNICQNQQQHQSIEIPILTFNHKPYSHQNYNHHVSQQDQFQSKLAHIPLVQAEEYRGYTTTANKYSFRPSNQDTIVNKYLPNQITNQKSKIKLSTSNLNKTSYPELYHESQASIRNYNIKASNYGQAVHSRTSSPINYRQTSKNSRSGSNNKAFGNFSGNSQLTKLQPKSHQKQTGSANILGNKLQKLRQQIKRQIDSIN